ncbi:MAG: hypothetical protein AAF399_17035 [Bacteroidota bacterium]
MATSSGLSFLLCWLRLLKKVGGFCGLLLLIGGNALAQEADRRREAFPYTFWSDSALLTLDEGWKHQDERSITLPFQPGNLQSSVLSCVFPRPDSAVGGWFLYLGRVAWQAQVKVNGKFLGMNERPLEPWYLPLPTTCLWQEAPNELRLELFVEQRYPNYPPPFIGLIDPIQILDSAQLRSRLRDWLPRSSADTVALVAPIFRQYGYQFDEFEALRSLQPLRKFGISTIQFAFPPPPKMRALCAELGLEEVEELQPDMVVCQVNAYEYDRATMPMHPRFWLDKAGNSTPYYGDFFVWGDPPQEVAQQGLPWLLILLIFVPMLIAVALKWINPSFFYGQLDLLLNPKRYVDAPAESLYTNSGLLWLLYWGKSICLMAFLTLGVYFLSEEQLWPFWGLTKPGSLLFQWFFPAEQVIGMLLRIAIVVIGANLLQIFLLSLIGQIFGIKAFLLKMLSLEVIGTFPLVFVLTLPIAMTLGGSSNQVFWILLFQGILVLGYVSRWVYVSYIGMERLFSFSLGMKILYICTFNLLPYLIWL